MARYRDCALFFCSGIVAAAATSFFIAVPTTAFATSYFPSTEFQDLDSWDKDEPDVWSELLSDFHEPGLSRGNGQAFVIRATVVPSFSYSMVIRVEEDGNGIITALSKQLPPRVNSPLITTPVAVSSNELSHLKAALAAERFWTSTNHQPAVVASDGVDLLLEVYDHGKYHVVYSSAAQNQSILRLTRMLLGLAHLHLPNE